MFTNNCKYIFNSRKYILILHIELQKYKEYSKNFQKSTNRHGNQDAKN